MNKGQRGLRNLVVATAKNHPAALFGRRKRNAAAIQWPCKNGLLYQKTKPIDTTRSYLDAPFFLGLKPFKDRVAITAANGDFTYSDLFNR